MAVTTRHKYLDRYPISKKSKYLIIGTIHPHRTENFELDFFYGNKNSIWSILADAFPKRNFSSLPKIEQTLDEHATAVTDMILQCDRANDAITQDTDLYNLCLNTERIREGIVNSSISTVFLTSRFGKNSAAKLFIDHFKIRHKDTWDERTSSFVVPKEVFGREIRAIVLFSPSGQANPGIAQSDAFKRKEHLYSDSKTPIKQFRIDFYREKFAHLGRE